MKDKYWAMIVLGMVSVYYKVDFAKEVVLMTIPVLAATVRDQINTI